MRTKERLTNFSKTQSPVAVKYEEGKPGEFLAEPQGEGRSPRQLAIPLTFLSRSNKQIAEAPYRAPKRESGRPFSPGVRKTKGEPRQPSGEVAGSIRQACIPA
jgi:hypothetical protein